MDKDKWINDWMKKQYSDYEYKKKDLYKQNILCDYDRLYRDFREERSNDRVEMEHRLRRMEDEYHRLKYQSDEETLESMNIKVIEAFLRRKKIVQLNKDV